VSLILALDTSAKPVSCALIRDEQILGCYYSHSNLTHSQTLMSMVEHLLKTSDVSVGELDAVAVNAGPGSFTGVRIGVSAVKGIAFTHNLSCISVSTLESMAENIAAEDAVICGVMDARCAQVYTALFECKNGVVNRITEDEAITIAELADRLGTLNRPVILVGDGSAMCYSALADKVPNVTLAPPAVRYQTAAATAVVAQKKWEAGETVSADALLPLYLRLPQAERELNARLGK